MVEQRQDLGGAGAADGPVRGWTAPGWEPVADAFGQNFAEGLEVGAAFACYHRGRKVVDLWGGLADPRTGQPWDEDTVALVFSTTKGWTSLCAHLLAQDGRLDLQAPVARYWPEFAQADKAQVTVADLLAHRAGLAWVDTPMTLEEALAWDPVCEALARQAPAWPPGSAHGYHATTFGWLVGEVVRRVAGQRIGPFLQDRVSRPLGARAWIGLPEAEEPKVARLVSALDPETAPATPGASGGGAAPDPELEAMVALAGEYLAPDGPLTKALQAPGGALAEPGIWNRPEVHRAEIPAANGICDARSLAQLYSACCTETETAAGGRLRLLRPEQLEAALVQQTEGPDRVLLGLDIQWGLGFMLHTGVIAEARMGGPRSFGHFGAGGSVGWADPDRELALGYVMNRMSLGATGDVRSARLAQAALRCAEAS
jgi:CubicO group peptidase (beta-lactamase class C family)